MFCTEYCMNKSVHQGMLPTINIHKFCSLDCCVQLTTNLRNYLEAAVEAWLPVAFLPHPLPSSFFKVDTKGDLSHAGQESSFVGHFPDCSLVAAWHDSQSQVFITIFIRVIMICPLDNAGPTYPLMDSMSDRNLEFFPCLLMICWITMFLIHLQLCMSSPKWELWHYYLLRSHCMPSPTNEMFYIWGDQPHFFFA